MNQRHRFILNAWNPSRRISHVIIPREKDWLCSDLEERALQETRMRNFQEMEELKKFCCTEAERAQQLRVDELSRQEGESQSAVHQEVQDKSELIF